MADDWRGRRYIYRRRSCRQAIPFGYAVAQLIHELLRHGLEQPDFTFVKGTWFAVEQAQRPQHQAVVIARRRPGVKAKALVAQNGIPCKAQVSRDVGAPALGRDDQTLVWVKVAPDAPPVPRMSEIENFDSSCPTWRNDPVTAMGCNGRVGCGSELTGQRSAIVMRMVRSVTKLD